MAVLRVCLANRGIGAEVSRSYDLAVWLVACCLAWTLAWLAAAQNVKVLKFTCHVVANMLLLLWL